MNSYKFQNSHEERTIIDRQNRTKLTPWYTSKIEIMHLLNDNIPYCMK
jgi:hypothetical protein